MNNKYFIKTTDSETAKKLIEIGFTLISHSGETWTFQNDNRANFERYEKIIYSNTLTF